jgi:Amt family ammonium transporter
MWEARLFALLLPLGVWLMQSGATPRNHEARVAASGLITLALATLMYAAVGFGFMFGGVGTVLNLPDLSRYVTYYTLPIGAQSWGIIGLRGFLLSGVNEVSAVQLFATYLPLVITCAMLPANFTLSKAGVGAQLVITLFISALLFPLLGFWIWGGGWLATLGLNLNLGHGVVDLGGLATAALVAGGSGVALLIFLPRRSDDEQALAQFPATYHPFRSLSGLVCALVGAAAITAGNPLLGAIDERIAAAALLNGGIAVSVAVLVALIYTVVTLRKPDLSAAARAALGALIIVSAGSILLPTWVALLAGLLAGLLATAGLYVVNHSLRWPHDTGLISNVLIPGVLGMLFSGIFANGAIGQGLNGIGASTYLGLSNLGVTGLLSVPGAPGDTGQMSAQLIGAVIVPAVAFALFSPIAWLLRHAPILQHQNEEVQAPEVMPEAVPALASPMGLHSSEVAPVDDLPTLPAPSPVQVVAESVGVPALAASNETVPPIAEQPALSVTDTINKPSNGQPPEPNQPAPRKETLLERLRRARNIKPEPEQPVQPRHVAYPNRVAGRRLSIRPMPKPDDANAAESGKPAR